MSASLRDVASVTGADKPGNALQIVSFERQAMEAVKPAHGTTTLGFLFQGGIIVAVDSRASMGTYICESCSALFSCTLYICDKLGVLSCLWSLQHRRQSKKS